MPNATPSGSFPIVKRGWAFSLPSSFSHNTGWSTRLFVTPGPQVESTIPFSAYPTTCPLLLMALACPLLPPSVGRACMTPFCQRKGRHVACVPKPQRSSPFGSKTDVSDIPTESPRSLIPFQLIELFFPPSVPSGRVGLPMLTLTVPATRWAEVEMLKGSRSCSIFSVQPELL